MLKRLAAAILFVSGLPMGWAGPASGLTIFNVRDYGATGLKAGSAQAAIQKAVDACGEAGGGTVYVPPGEYSTGTIQLRSRVRFFVEAGATIFSIKDKEAFPKDVLFYGEDLTGITLEDRGTIDGQGGYEYRLKGNHEDDFIYPNQVEMEKLGKPLVRSFPKTDQFGKLVLLLRCTDVRISGLNFLDSPSWTMHLYGCVRTVIDNVTISNCVITDSNRGLAFMNFDGGVVENVVISGLIIDCVRYDWFWWGDGWTEGRCGRSRHRPKGCSRRHYPQRPVGIRD